ncbi:MAG TPA: hypothetical protein VK530_19675 [Candidatus Acidoferrum sp.]|nr:hypothetical protein [Candidatus Acidoferrum sp.]
MKTNALVLLAVALTIHLSAYATRAAVIFSQDFSSAPNGPTTAYVSANPNSGQWDAIGTSGGGTTVSVVGGALTYTRSIGNSGSYTRTDISPAPLGLVYSFTLTVSGNAVAQTTAATWQVGEGYSPGINTPETEFHSRFGINFTTTAGTFQFRDIGGGANSANFSGAQAVTWVINNSGGTMSYLAPDNTTRVVANDKWDLWAGSTQVFDERNSSLITPSMTDLKFAFNQGGGSITMDNFQIDSIEPVPEPTNIALSIFAIGVLSLGGLRVWRTRRARTNSASRV